MEFPNLASAAGWIARSTTNSPVVAIDGWLGAGKTCLGKKVAHARQCWTLDLDCFRTGGTDEFVGALQVQSLRQAIEHSTVPIVIVGVCMLQVLPLLGVKADRVFYVKRMNAGVWADEDDAIGDGLTVRPSKCAENMEVHNYHRAHRPDLRADTVIEVQCGRFC